MKGPVELVVTGARCQDGKEQEEKNWFQILAVIISCIPSITAGMLFAWSSPSIVKITEDKVNYDITLDEASYFTVIPPVAAILFSFVFSTMTDKIGVKYTLLSMAIPHTIAWILIASARSVYVFYVSRFLAGMADACFFATVPAYIGEITTPSVRGTWGNCMTFFIYFGQFLVNLIGSYCSIQTTAYICVTLPVIFAVSFYFMPESPYFLIMRGRYEEAREALRMLRRKENIDKDFAELQRDVERQMSESGSWRDLFAIESNRKALYSGVFLRTSQQLGGISTFAVYTTYIFQQAGGNVDATTSAIIYTLLLTVMNFCAIFTLDRLGRKKSYLYSLLFCGILLSVEGIYFYLKQEVPSIDLSMLNWLPIGGMVVFVVLYSFGLGIVPTLMMGELFSASIKGKGLCILNICFGLNVSVITKVFHLLETKVGLYSPFLLFAVSCFVSTVLTLWFVPETKGKTLEEIQQSLKSKKKIDVISAIGA